MRELVVLFSDNGSFTDYSTESAEYLRDEVSFSYVDAEDYLYVGLYKPFNKSYYEKVTALSGGTLSAEYYNGSWTSLTFKDDTDGLNRSGFIGWSRENVEDWESVAVNSQDLYWVRFKFGVDATINYIGWNIVFSDDLDLQKEYSVINDFLSSGQSSFISYHVGARDEMVQTMRNGGYSVRDGDAKRERNFAKWDFLDPEEIRQASKYLVLSRIFFERSDEIDDKWMQKSRDYAGKFGEAFKLSFQTLDEDDDGVEDTREILSTRSIRIVKE